MRQIERLRSPKAGPGPRTRREMTVPEKAAALLCVLGILLFPAAAGFVFFRVLGMAGTPRWWLVLNGALTAAGLGVAVYFFLTGLVPALKRTFFRGRDRRSVRS